MGAAPSKSPSEILQENKDAIRQSIREIDREERQINRRKTEVENKIKKSAAEGRLAEVKIFAKDIIRIKKAVEKFEVAKANLQNIQIQLMTASSQEAIMSSMKGAVNAYRSLNSIMDPKGMQRIMSQYQKESMRQEIMQEVMDGALDDTDAETTEATDELVQQTLQEMGIQAIGDTPLPGAQADQAQAQAQAQPGLDADLTNRLNNL